ncbi:probable mediator of RNA polymerase II transcription subunit 26b isoform X2 [Eucalyptus grandis]|nr:probable mediator of RNA polymerase II transcription subunit 26b isoform X2 [Eucalyptus grandis]XP_039162177.1 probable mediator of RNA polymerase II transcription subunit 26b isoform X2 [Eucalyptus grandis]
MGESLDDWREFFRTTVTDVFEFIDKAITIAALDCPQDFLSQRGRIAEQLFSCGTARDGGDCAAESKESKANGDTGNAASSVGSIKHGDGEAESFGNNIEEASLVVCEVLRIKQVLDNSRHESESALLESLRRLRSMTITLKTLKKTKIGISVNSLRRNCGSKLIAQLAHDITMRWKAMVEEISRSTEDVADPCNVGDRTTSSVKNIRKPGQEQCDVSQAGSLADRNRRLNVNQHRGTVKPNMSSNADPRTIPQSEIVSRKFEKERMLRSQKSNETVTGGKRPLASRQNIKCSNKVVAEVGFESSERETQELHRKAETDKRRRTVLVLDLCDLPKMATSLKAPCTTTRKAHRQRVLSQSLVSSF